MSKRYMLSNLNVILFCDQAKFKKASQLGYFPFFHYKSPIKIHVFDHLFL